VPVVVPDPVLVAVTAAAVGNSGASAIVTGLPEPLCRVAICWIIPAPDAVAADAIYPPGPVNAKPEETVAVGPIVPDGTSEALNILFPTTYVL
jgi:hypothetical protein